MNELADYYGHEGLQRICIEEMIKKRKMMEVKIKCIKREALRMMKTLTTVGEFINNIPLLK